MRAKLKLYALGPSSRIYEVGKAVEEGDDAVRAVRVAYSRGGKCVGVVAVPQELQPSVSEVLPLLKSIPLYVEAGVDSKGRLVDPEFLGFGEQGLEKTASEDPLTEATLVWKKSGRKKKHLGQVLTELRKVVAGRASDFGSRGLEVPQAEYMKAGLKALRRYDPKKGARASTYVIGSLKEANRPLLRRATILRVPEARLQKVGKVNRAFRELEDELGRKPTTAEAAKRTGISRATLELIRREAIPIHITSKEEFQSGDTGTRLKEVWALLRPDLSGQERNVYDALAAKPAASNTEIAKQLKISQSQVSRYRQRLRRKVLDGNR